MVEFIDVMKHIGTKPVPDIFGRLDMSMYTLMLYRMSIINHQGDSMDCVYAKTYNVT